MSKDKLEILVEKDNHMILKLTYFFIGSCVVTFVGLWFYMSFQVLSAKRNSIDRIREQVQFHRILYMKERGDRYEFSARNIYEIKRMVYYEMVEDYKLLLRKPIYRIPGYLLGFHNYLKEGEKCN